MLTMETSIIESDASLSDNEATVATPTESTSIRRSLKRRRTHPVWEYARTSIQGLKASRGPKEGGAKKIFYCKHPQCSDYNVLSSTAAAKHMELKHGIILDEGPYSKAQKHRQRDLLTVFSIQKQQQLEKQDQTVRQALREAITTALIHQALLRLIVNHDLPLNAVEWPELHTLVYSLNWTASDLIWKSRSTIARKIDETFNIKHL